MSAPPVGLLRIGVAVSEGIASRDQDAEGVGRAWRLALENALEGSRDTRHSSARDARQGPAPGRSFAPGRPPEGSHRGRAERQPGGEGDHASRGGSRRGEPQIEHPAALRRSPLTAAMIGGTAHQALEPALDARELSASGSPSRSLLLGLGELLRAMQMNDSCGHSAVPSVPVPPTAPTAFCPAWSLSAEGAEPLAPDEGPGVRSGDEAAPILLRGGSGESAAEPIRWHAEWSEAGLRIWLGLDLGRAGSLAGVVEPLVAEARRRAELRGTRLLTFVCNGRTVFDEMGAPSTPRRLPEEIP